MASPFTPPTTPGASGYPLGLTGATSATRYVGATSSGAPASGTFAVGDFVIDQTGAVYVCTVAGSPGTWTQAGGTGGEIVYSEITTSANITDTAEATATALITAGPATYSGQPVIAHFFAPQIATDTAAASDVVVVTLWEGATELGRIGVVKTVVATQPNVMPFSCHYRFTPSAASHTYKLCAYASSTTGTPKIQCGSGGVGVYVPAFLRFTYA